MKTSKVILWEIRCLEQGHTSTTFVLAGDSYGVLQAEQDVSKAIFTTTSTFAPRITQDRLIKPYLPYRLELVDKDKLIKRLIS